MKMCVSLHAAVSFPCSVFGRGISVTRPSTLPREAMRAQHITLRVGRLTRENPREQEMRTMIFIPP